MTANGLSASWQAFWPAFGNHLWQSTLFAVAAGALTLMLRSNQARTRYWLWLLASVKFLLPFSLLISLGNVFSWRQSSDSGSGFYTIIEMAEEPFPHAQSAHAATTTDLLHRLIGAAPMFAAFVWLVGFTAVLLLWFVRWKRLLRALRAAAPVNEGREVTALRRLEPALGIRGPIETRLSQASLEPGIFGIIRPVLVWPRGISELLSDSHLDAVLAHELSHVRRRDNLAACLHMLVEAVFWFHPLVWWMGARLLEERERACDEEVLLMGNHPQAYAESILKICEFCLGSSLACVAGVTGADLRKRIASIMNESIANKPGFAKRALLAAAGAAAIITPIATGLLQPAQTRAQSRSSTATTAVPGIKSVSIKLNKTGEVMPPFKVVSNPPGKGVAVTFGPNEFKASNVTLRLLIRHAYKAEGYQVTGDPEILDSDRYDVVVTFSGPPVNDLASGQADSRRLALQALLAEKFNVALHREMKDVPVYALVVAKNGPKMQAAKPGDNYADGLKGLDGSPAGPHRIAILKNVLWGQAVQVSDLPTVLGVRLDRPLVDRTGLTGEYDFKAALPPGPKDGEKLDPKTVAQTVTALEEQLGLRFDPQTAPREFLVVDRAAKLQVN